jgi:hypothetical protein
VYEKEIFPADLVFKNIKSLKVKSKEQLLSIMNSWGNPLGVTCKFVNSKMIGHLRRAAII